MALIHRALPLPIHAPIPPDRYFCHPTDDLIPGIPAVPSLPVHPLSCQRAVDENGPDGRTPIRYFMKDPRPSEGEWIPHREHYGPFCRVSIETAGPYEHLPHSVLLSPQKIRGLAGFLIQKCAVENRGPGGFITMGLEKTLAYTHNQASSHNPYNEQWGGNFLTISIQSRFRLGEDTLEPGSRDRNIAALLSASIATNMPDPDHPYDLVGALF